MSPTYVAYPRRRQGPRAGTATAIAGSATGSAIAVIAVIESVTGIAIGGGRRSARCVAARRIGTSRRRRMTSTISTGGRPGGTRTSIGRARAVRRGIIPMSATGIGTASATSTGTGTATRTGSGATRIGIGIGTARGAIAQGRRIRRGIETGTGTGTAIETVIGSAIETETARSQGRRAARRRQNQHQRRRRTTRRWRTTRRRSSRSSSRRPTRRRASCLRRRSTTRSEFFIHPSSECPVLSMRPVRFLYHHQSPMPPPPLLLSIVLHLFTYPPRARVLCVYTYLSSCVFIPLMYTYGLL